MKALIALTAVLVAAGCASTGETYQVAQAECKIHPVTTRSVADVRKPHTPELNQRLSEAELATSSYRMQQLARNNAYNMNNIEDALRDCQSTTR